MTDEEQQEKSAKYGIFKVHVKFTMIKTIKVDAVVEICGNDEWEGEDLAKEMSIAQAKRTTRYCLSDDVFEFADHERLSEDTTIKGLKILSCEYEIREHP